MEPKITEKQRSILDFIKKEIKEKGYPPSVREICQAVGLRSTSTVHGHLKRLEKIGVLYKDPTKPRALRVIEKEEEQYNVLSKKELIEVPIVGKVAAGTPLLAVENIEDTFTLPLDFVKSSNAEVYMLEVRGDSMIEAGILDGDMVIVKKQENAVNGDIVVALLEDEATVKTFYKEKDHIRLQPENSMLEPIITKQVSILGKVIGVIRRL
jgi:repressor LexA